MNIIEFKRAIFTNLKTKIEAVDTYYAGLTEPITSITTVFAAGPQDTDLPSYPIVKISPTTLVANMELERFGNIFEDSATTVTNNDGVEVPDSYLKKPYPKSYKCRIYIYSNTENNVDQAKVSEAILLAMPNGGYIQVNAEEKVFCKPYTNISTPISGDKILEDIFIYDITEIFLGDPSDTGVNTSIITSVDFGDINLIT